MTDYGALTLLPPVCHTVDYALSSLAAGTNLVHAYLRVDTTIMVHSGVLYSLAIGGLVGWLHQTFMLPFYESANDSTILFVLPPTTTTIINQSMQQ